MLGKLQMLQLRLRLFFFSSLVDNVIRPVNILESGFLPGQLDFAPDQRVARMLIEQQSSNLILIVHVVILIQIATPALREPTLQSFSGQAQQLPKLVLLNAKVLGVGQDLVLLG
jgi:hypothetical protein